MMLPWSFAGVSKKFESPNVHICLASQSALPVLAPTVNKYLFCHMMPCLVFVGIADDVTV